MSNHRLLVEHSFHGRRFEDGGLDVDIAIELSRYKSLLIDVAKELWRAANPEQVRLPANFEDRLELKLFTITNNCVLIPLQRVVPPSDQPRIPSELQSTPQHDEFDEAVLLIANTIQAAGSGRLLPAQFPRRLLNHFQNYGKTLLDDEWIEQQPAGYPRPVRFDHGVRAQLLFSVGSPYEDAIELTGEITMVRLSNEPLARLRLSDGQSVDVSFCLADEQTVATALRDHAATRLLVVGRGQFSAEGTLTKIIAERLQLLPDGNRPFVPGVKPIWEVFEESIQAAPPGTFDNLPTDGATNLDRYLYGSGQ